jgi:hypothetical protein
MGYTHYWERPRVLPRTQFVAAIEDCRRLRTTLNIPLGNESGQQQPIFNTTEICFNGHTKSGQITSVQRAEGLIWPSHTAHGLAVIGEAGATVGSWGAGPRVNARVLGPDGDGSYETFRVERIRRPRHPQDQGNNGWFFNCCKTNYRPYDLCVQGCLIALHHHLSSSHFRIDSDGDSQAWNDARDACQHVLGFGIDWGEGKLAPTPPQQPPSPGA